MTNDAKKQNEKTKTDTQDLGVSTNSAEEEKNKKKYIETTELAPEQVSNFADNIFEESSSLATKKPKNLEHGELDDEAFEIKNIQPETNQTSKSSKQKRQRSVFAPMFFGGLSAGFLSFAIVYLIFNSNLLGKSTTITEMEISLNDQIAKNSNKITYIESMSEDQILKISKLVNDLETLDLKIQEVSANLARNSILVKDNQDMRLRVQNLEESGTVVDDRISSLEKRPVAETLSRDVMEAYNKEVSDLVEFMAVQRKKAERILDNAYVKEEKLGEIEQKTKARSALYDIKKVIETGKGFREPLEKFQQLTGATIPQVLRVASLDGIITLEELTEAFPEVARAAIAADQIGSEFDGTPESLFAFIKSQFKGRSIVPKEGTDADAILSRVEAALKKDNLHLALYELAKLEPPAADIMANWKARAIQRIEVIKKIDFIDSMAD